MPSAACARLYVQYRITLASFRGGGLEACWCLRGKRRAEKLGLMAEGCWSPGTWPSPRESRGNWLDKGVTCTYPPGWDELLTPIGMIMWIWSSSVCIETPPLVSRLIWKDGLLRNSYLGAERWGLGFVSSQYLCTKLCGTESASFSACLPHCPLWHTHCGTLPPPRCGWEPLLTSFLLDFHPIITPLKTFISLNTGFFR